MKLTTTNTDSDTARDQRLPSVSVVVTTFQSASTVGRALDSVAVQTIAPLEVFVCDDGSTDGTLKEARRHADVEPVSLPHSGTVAVSRNAGVDRAGGDWIAFLDGDDEWTPEHLELFGEVLATEAARSFDLFGGNGARLDVEGRETPFFTARTLLGDGPVTTWDLVRIRPIITSSAIARREAVLAAGGFPDDAESVAAEDFDLWYRLSKKGGVYFDPRVHVRYHETSQGLTKREGGWRARAAAIHVLERLVAHEDRADEKRALREALATDRLTLAAEYLKAGKLVPATKTVGRAARAGLGPVATVSSRAIARRVKAAGKRPSEGRGDG